MAVRKAAARDRLKASDTTGQAVEQKLLAFAEQLGTLVGTVQSRTGGWLDRQSLSTEVARIRDSAAELLDHVAREAEATVAKGKAAVKAAAPASTRVQKAAPKAGSKAASAAARPRDRGPVDAPGKRHRKPPPQERVDRMMGMPVGKKMGQKSVKVGRMGRQPV